MNTHIWKINKKELKKTNLTLYSNFIKKNYKVNSGNDFNKIWKWSVNNPKIFWKSIWDFTRVKGDLGGVLLKESDIFYKNKFFPNARLNYAENILSTTEDHINLLSLYVHFEDLAGFQTKGQHANKILHPLLFEEP